MDRVESLTVQPESAVVGDAGVARNPWRTLIVILFGVTTIFTNIYAPQPIIPTIGRAFNVTPANAGLSISLVVLGLGIAALIYGPLSDSIGRKPVMVATAIALIIPTLGAAIAPTYPIFLACRIMQGLLIPGTTAVGLAYLQDEFPPKMRGIGTSAYVSATALGGLIGRLQAGFIADVVDWRWGFASFVLTTGMSALVMAIFLPNSRAVAARRQLPTAIAALTADSVVVPPPPRLTIMSLLTAYSRLGVFFRQRRIVGGGIIGFTMFFGFVSIFTYLPYRVERPPFNLSPTVTSLLYLVYFVGFLVTPWSGRLSDRIGRRAVIGLALSSMLIGLLLTGFDGIVIVVAGLLLLNIGLLAAHAASSAFVSDNTTEGKGSAASFYLVFYYMGGAIGPYVCGLAWQAFGWVGVMGGCLITVVMAMISLVTLCAPDGRPRVA